MNQSSTHHLSITTDTGEAVAVEYGCVVPFDVERLFKRCQQKVIAEGVGVGDEKFIQKLTVMCDIPPVEADLQTVRTHFRYTHHPEERTQAQAIAAFLTHLTRRDLVQRYHYLKNQYADLTQQPSQKTKAEQAADAIEKHDPVFTDSP